ncbi:histone chaperone [Malassezia cuniculi]|uniref:Histone chaperone n=1 Tax=Malassezia cuniculi TaxID=948313 RepID=A0AAF0EWR3_9BASI|nr:histone chaperone [Malassezia cuniculi]
MSNTLDIGKNRNENLAAPTPQNTPLNNSQPMRELLQRPTVGTIGEEEEAPALPNAALTGLIQDRLNSLVGRSSGYIESLPAEVRRRVEGLKGLNVEHQKLEAEFQREILALEKRFAERYAPLYERRREIILGGVEPTAAEVESGEAVDRVDDDEDEDEEDEEPRRSLANISVSTDAPKGIPEFWLTALKNHVALSELITERDEEALRFLTDIRLRYLDTPEGAAPGQAQAGFQLEFVFAPNDYLANEVLTKTYFYQDAVGFSGDLVYDHAEGSPIEWKSPEHDLTHRVETKKQRNKNTNETRTIKRLVPTESFFNFFSPPKAPEDDDEDDEEQLEEYEERLELDYQVGEDLKDRIIPHAVDFFTGKALHYENPDLWGDDEDLDDDYDDDEDDDDEDDDEPRPARAQDGQECKQQ